MPNTLLHKFVSAIANDPNTALVRPTNWNDEHTFTGGSDYNVLSRLASSSDGVAWLDLNSYLGGVNVLSFGALGNGSTDDRAAIASAMSAASAAGRAVVFPGGRTYRIGSNITLTTPMLFLPGAVFSIDTGVIVSISNTIEAGNYTIFSGLGTVSFTRPTEINAIWFGVVYDDSTLNHTAINRAINSLSSVDFGVVNFPSGTLRIGGSINLKSNVWLKGNYTRIRGAIDQNWLVAENTSVTNIRITQFKFENLGAPSGSEPACIRVRSTSSGSVTNTYVQYNEFLGFPNAVIIEGTNVTLARYYPPGATSNIITFNLALRGSDGRNYVTDNYVYNSLEEASSSEGTIAAIYVLSSYTTIARNRIQNVYNGILIGNDTAVTTGVICTENTLINCWGNNGIYAPRCQDVVISNNHLEQVNTDGIAVRGNGVVVSGNRIVNAYKSAIRLQHYDATVTCFNVDVIGNVVSMGSITANFLIGDNPGTANPGLRNIRIADNVVEGPGRVTGPLIIMDAGTDQNRDIEICNNNFRNINTTGATATNQGPYAVVVVGNPNTPQRGLRCSFHDNLISEMAPIIALASARLTYGVEEKNNFFGFSDGTSLNTKETEGWVRFRVTSGGTIDYKSTDQAEEDSPNGAISNVAIGGSTGQITLTFKGKVWVSGCTVNQSGGNRLDMAVLTVSGNTSVERLNTSQTWTVTLYDIDTNGAQVAAWPAAGDEMVSLWCRVQYFTEFFRTAHGA